MSFKKIIVALGLAGAVLFNAAYAGSVTGVKVAKGVYSFTTVAKAATPLNDPAAIQLAQAYLTAQKIPGTINQAYVMTTSKSHKTKMIVRLNTNQILDFSPALSARFLAHKPSA